MIPEPLHPAIVHFPIVLLLLGAPLAVAAAVWRKNGLPALAAAVLLLGAAGAVVATLTGENDAEMAGELPGAGEQVLEDHEEWGERARNLGVAAALLAIASMAVNRWPLPARGLGAVAAIAALAAAFAVARAGHYGGRVVYQFGVGVNQSAAATPSEIRAETGKKHSQKDDD